MGTGASPLMDTAPGFTSWRPGKKSHSRARPPRLGSRVRRAPLRGLGPKKHLQQTARPRPLPGPGLSPPSCPHRISWTGGRGRGPRGEDAQVEGRVGGGRTTNVQKTKRDTPPIRQRPGNVGQVNGRHIARWGGRQRGGRDGGLGRTVALLRSSGDPVIV